MNEQMIKNDPIADMHREVKNNASLFDGFVVMAVDGGPAVYHVACDEDVVKIDEDEEMPFADVLDEVLKHAAECEPLDDEEDDEDDEDLDYDDEEIEP